MIYKAPKSLKESGRNQGYCFNDSCLCKFGQIRFWVLSQVLAEVLS